MKTIKVINDDHRYHVFVGDVDFWLTTRELVELYKTLGHTKI